MKVIILEVCRSPEIKKETETLILSTFFTKQIINYEIYSNDFIWQDKTLLSKDSVGGYLKTPDVRIVHLAMHGYADGLILRWSKATNPRERIPEDILTSFDIRLMSEWKGKLVVSGACYSSTLAASFLDAGATDVIAPKSAIPWTNLGNFFSLFYKTLFSSQNISSALNFAISQFPEYESYHVYSLGSRQQPVSEICKQNEAKFEPQGVRDRLSTRK